MMSMALIGGAVSKLSLKREQPCVKIFREFSIDYKGRVFPCCNIFPDLKTSENLVFGNVEKDSIFSIFSSKLWAKWRRELYLGASFAPCNTCKDGYFDTDIDDREIREEILNNYKE